MKSWGASVLSISCDKNNAMDGGPPTSFLSRFSMFDNISNMSWGVKGLISFLGSPQLPPPRFDRVSRKNTSYKPACQFIRTPLFMTLNVVTHTSHRPIYTTSRVACWRAPQWSGLLTQYPSRKIHQIKKIFTRYSLQWKFYPKPCSPKALSDDCCQRSIWTFT